MTVPEPEDNVAAALPSGTMFGRHSVIRLVASGGMADVYEAEHLDLQKRVAIKVMRPSLAGDPSLVQRFVLEARAASKLRHPNVIDIRDVGVQGGRPYMIMELLEGVELGRVITGSPALSIGRIADLMLPVLSAVCVAHTEGVLHRDLKPENIFIARDRGSRERPVLLDFGISRLVSAKQDAQQRGLTRVGQTLGTPEYMSLEQLLGTQSIDARADQYALGVILYVCATKHVPFAADDLERLVGLVRKGNPKRPSAFRSDLPAAFDELVLRALSVERKDRFESVRELGAALWPLASPLSQAMWAEEFGDPALAPPSSPPAAPSPPKPGEVAVAATVAAIPTPQPTRPSLPVGPPVVLRPSDLRVFSAFESSDDATLAELLRVANVRRYAAGACLLRQGAHGSGCFLLVSGEVQIVKSTALDSKAGSHWIVGTVGAGSLIGQIALVDHLPRTATVVAVGEIVVVQIVREVFDKLTASTSEIACRLREQIALAGIRQLRHATRRFAAIVDRKEPPRAGTDPRRELVYVQVAAQEWGLPIAED